MAKFVAYAYPTAKLVIIPFGIYSIMSLSKAKNTLVRTRGYQAMLVDSSSHAALFYFDAFILFSNVGSTRYFQYNFRNIILIGSLLTFST